MYETLFVLMCTLYACYLFSRVWAFIGSIVNLEFIFWGYDFPGYVCIQVSVILFGDLRHAPNLHNLKTHMGPEWVRNNIFFILIILMMYYGPNTFI